jgi:hypothetical protein
MLAGMPISLIDINDQSFDIEIIPLQEAWEYITLTLPEKVF